MNRRAVDRRPVGRRRLHLPAGEQEPRARSIRSSTDNRARNYTSNGRRPHALVFNYCTNAPKLSRTWDNVVVKAVFDNWQFSGVTHHHERHVWRASATATPTCRPARCSGTGAHQRRRQPRRSSSAIRICRAEQRTFERQFKTECIAPPTDQYRLGTATERRVSRPRLHELGHLGVQERADGRARGGSSCASSSTTRSTPTSGPAVNTNATFDYTTGALTNANTFGGLNGNTNSARRIQLGARFTFLRLPHAAAERADVENPPSRRPRVRQAVRVRRWSRRPEAGRLVSESSRLFRSSNRGACTPSMLNPDCYKPSGNQPPTSSLQPPQPSTKPPASAA